MKIFVMSLFLLSTHIIFASEHEKKYKRRRTETTSHATPQSHNIEKLIFQHFCISLYSTLVSHAAQNIGAKTQIIEASFSNNPSLMRLYLKDDAVLQKLILKEEDFHSQINAKNIHFRKPGTHQTINYALASKTISPDALITECTLSNFIQVTYNRILKNSK